MSSPSIPPDLPKLTGLVGFGIVYNAAVGRLRRRYGDHGLTGVLVVIGVAVVLAAALPRLRPKEWIHLLACFAAAGAPMVAGDIARHLSRQSAADEALGSVLRGWSDRV